MAKANAKIAITGASGFTGQYVAAEFERNGYDILRLSGPATASRMKNAVGCDLTDQASIREAFKSYQLNAVIHLAAESFVDAQAQQRFYAVNTIGTANLLQTLDELGSTPDKVILASSANVYGNNSSPNLEESEPLAPVNHYGGSKMAMEGLSRQWHRRFPIIITRPFNYTGPGQSERFLLPKLVGHFKRKSNKIKLGNLDVERDFSDVRDIAKCYLRLFQSGATAETINLCSGRTTSIQEIIQLLAELTRHRIEIQPDQTLIRQHDIKFLSGSNRKLKQITGYAPDTPIAATLESMLSDADKKAAR